MCFTDVMVVLGEVTLGCEFNHPNYKKNWSINPVFACLCLKK